MLRSHAGDLSLGGVVGRMGGLVVGAAVGLGLNVGSGFSFFPGNNINWLNMCFLEKYEK